VGVRGSVGRVGPAARCRSRGSSGALGAGRRLGCDCSRVLGRLAGCVGAGGLGCPVGADFRRAGKSTRVGRVRRAVSASAVSELRSLASGGSAVCCAGGAWFGLDRGREGRLRAFASSGLVVLACRVEAEFLGCVRDLFASVREPRRVGQGEFGFGLAAWPPAAVLSVVRSGAVGGRACGCRAAVCW